MNRTITVRRDYLHYIKKYNRYEKRHSMTSAHCSPCFIGLKEGDSPLSHINFPTRPYYWGNPWFLAPAVRYYRWKDARAQ